MNPKGNTRARYYGTNKPHKDKFKGHRGKIRKQELFKSRLKSSQVIDSEITELQSRYAKVSFQSDGLGESSQFLFLIINQNIYIQMDMNNVNVKYLLNINTSKCVLNDNI